jgi:hypothetical protein
MTGAPGVEIIPTAFNSGHAGVALINTSKVQKVVRLNIKNFKFGERYYVYSLTGNPDEDFSRKVFINGTGNTLDAGGPDNYLNIKANSSLIADEILIRILPLSATFVLVEPGNKELIINENVVGVNDIPVIDNFRIFPNPSGGQFSIINIPEGINKIGICNITGMIIFTGAISGNTYEWNASLPHLAPGIYFIQLEGKGKRSIRKVIIN